VLALLLPSCVPSSPPLSDPDGAKADERLLGAWKYVDGGPTDSLYWFLFVGKSGHAHAPPGIMKAVKVDNDKDEQVTVRGPLYFFPTSLANTTYANVFDDKVLDRERFLRWDKRNIKDCVLIKYAVEKDRLTFWPMDTDAAEAAVNKGQLKGVVEEKGPLKLKDVALTGGDELARFLSSGGDKLLFPDAHRAVFERVR
jgi:hypothetical protein